jgi:hypothetical protein
LVAACNHGTNQTLRVWVDVLAIAQWPGAKQKNDLQDLESCVAFSSALLLVVCVHPAIHAAQRGELPIEVRQQIPFDRIWCLLEVRGLCPPFGNCIFACRSCRCPQYRLSATDV